MKILFAVDGSRCSRQAIDSVIKMKCPVGTEFKVVTVVDFFHPISANVEVRNNEFRAAGKFIDETVEKLKSAHPNVEVEGSVLDGHAVEQVLQESENWPADLIIVGSHGRTGFSELVMGSVSRSILANACCAVRVVRKGESRDEMKVLLGLDDSEHSRYLIEHLVRLPWSAGTKFKLVNVIPEVDSSVLFDPDVEFAKSAATKYDALLDSQAKWLKQAAEKINKTFDQEVASHEVLIGEPRKTLLDVAKKWPADIIMLGSHGKRGIEKLFLGSVSEGVATHAPCTVEVTRVPAFRKNKVTA